MTVELFLANTIATLITPFFSFSFGSRLEKKRLRRDAVRNHLIWRIKSIPL